LGALVWVIVALVVLAILGAVVWSCARKQRTEHLRGQFGPEYERAIRPLVSIIGFPCGSLSVGSVSWPRACDSGCDSGGSSCISQ
jgi:hypothetical protein